MPAPKVQFQHQFYTSTQSDVDANLIPDPETFRILLTGAFSGHAILPHSLADRKTIEIDRDNFDEILSAIKPRLVIPINQTETAVIEIREMDDFHPDQLFRKLTCMTSLFELRNQLKNPSTFPQAKATINGWGKGLETESTAKPVENPGNVLDQMLDEHERSAAFLLPGLNEWERFIQDVVAPYVIAAPDPRLADYERIVDEAISVRMRTIIHHPDFQALEALWRSLHLVVRNLDTDAHLKLYLLDVTWNDLKEDLTKSPNLSLSGFYTQIVSRVKDRPWAVVAGAYQPHCDPVNLESLGNLAQIVMKAGVTFFAGIDTAALGCASLPETPDPEDWSTDTNAQQLWDQLRQFPPSKHLAVTSQRFLARLPYGNNMTEVESFKFEEFSATHSHEHYLWAMPSFLYAMMLGQSFTDHGWSFRPGVVCELKGLPLCVYTDEDGDRVAKPVAEIVVRTNTLNAMIERGINPILCGLNQDFIRIGACKSITGEPILGQWNKG